MSEQQLIDLHCSTGLHEALKLDDAQWARLSYVGIGIGLEFRNCECGSTLARELGK